MKTVLRFLLVTCVLGALPLSPCFAQVFLSEGHIHVAPAKLSALWLSNGNGFTMQATNTSIDPTQEPQNPTSTQS